MSLENQITSPYDDNESIFGSVCAVDANQVCLNWELARQLVFAYPIPHFRRHNLT